MLDTLLELAIVSYPIYHTVNYVSLRVAEQDSEQKVKYNPSDVHFLATWWSAYGVLNVVEDLLVIDKIPLYGLVKSGVLVSLMFKDYQNSILKKTAQTTSYVKTWIGETELIRGTTDKIINIIQDYQRPQNSKSLDDSIPTSNPEDGYIESILKRIRG